MKNTEVFVYSVTKRSKVQLVSIPSLVPIFLHIDLHFFGNKLSKMVASSF